MTDTSNTQVTVTVDGPEPVVAAVEAALQADWTRVLESITEDITVFTVDVALPTPWSQPVTAFLRDPKVSGRLVVKSAEAPDRSSLGVEGAGSQEPADSAAELLFRRLREHYRVELDHEESDLRSHDVRVEALIFPGRLPDGSAAYS